MWQVAGSRRGVSAWMESVANATVILHSFLGLPQQQINNKATKQAMSSNTIARISLILAAVLSVMHVSSAFSSTANPARRTTTIAGISTLARTVPGPRIAGGGGGGGDIVSTLRMSAEDEAERLRAQAAKLREEVAEATGKSVAEIEAETAPKAEEEQAQQTVQLNADGTVYDDETPEYRDPLSDNMRQRLMREASTGLDSNQKQTNVILYISIAVAVLVLLGGQGILY